VQRFDLAAQSLHFFMLLKQHTQQKSLKGVHMTGIAGRGKVRSDGCQQIVKHTLILTPQRPPEKFESVFLFEKNLGDRR
jgi:hypothetical protein